MALPRIDEHGWLTVPWSQYLSRSGNAGVGGQYGYDAVSETMCLIIEYDDTEQALEELLGVNFADGGEMSRTPPLFHPERTWLRCMKVATKPLKWTGKRLSDTGIPSATWDFNLLTCSFQRPPWNRTLGDAELAAMFPDQEWQRFTSFVPQPVSEILQRDANTFKWAETAAGGPTITTEIPQPLGQPLTKIDFSLVWWNVPAKGLLDPITRTATHLDTRLNTVNSTTDMFGFPIGTMLFKGYRLIERETPNAGDVIEGIGDTPQSYNVELYFQYFNPPPGGSFFGHNLLPFPGEHIPPAAAVPGDNKWYLASTDGTTTGSKRLLGSSDHSEIFTLPN